MKIAMLARNPNLYSHQRLVEAAETRGHQIDVIDTLRVYINVASHRPELRYKGEKLEAYDAVIPRIGASVTFFGTAVLRQFEVSRYRAHQLRTPDRRTARHRAGRSVQPL